MVLNFVPATQLTGTFSFSWAAIQLGLGPSLYSDRYVLSKCFEEGGAGRSCGRRGGTTEQKGSRNGAGEDGREDVQARHGGQRIVLVMSLWLRWTSCCSPPASSQWVACVLLLRCRHLSLCGACEPAVNTCPVCASTKNASLHVLLS